MIASSPYRIAVVGASSLAGKELSDALADSPLAACDFVLLDEEDAGQMTTAGDEATFIQKIDEESFAGVDFVFFAGDPETHEKVLEDGAAGGASIVDMTYALESGAGGDDARTVGRVGVGWIWADADRSARAGA